MFDIFRKIKEKVLDKKVEPKEKELKEESKETVAPEETASISAPVEEKLIEKTLEKAHEEDISGEVVEDSEAVAYEESQEIAKPEEINVDIAELQQKQTIDIDSELSISVTEEITDIEETIHEEPINIAADIKEDTGMVEPELEAQFDLDRLYEEALQQKQQLQEEEIIGDPALTDIPETDEDVFDQVKGQMQSQSPLNEVQQSTIRDTYIEEEKVLDPDELPVPDDMKQMAEIESVEPVLDQPEPVIEETFIEEPASPAILSEEDLVKPEEAVISEESRAREVISREEIPVPTEEIYAPEEPAVIPEEDLVQPEEDEIHEEIEPEAEKPETFVEEEKPITPKEMYAPEEPAVIPEEDLVQPEEVEIHEEIEPEAEKPETFVEEEKPITPEEIYAPEEPAVIPEEDLVQPEEDEIHEETNTEENRVVESAIPLPEEDIQDNIDEVCIPAEDIYPLDTSEILEAQDLVEPDIAHHKPDEVLEEEIISPERVFEEQELVKTDPLVEQPAPQTEVVEPSSEKIEELHEAIEKSRLETRHEETSEIEPQAPPLIRYETEEVTSIEEIHDEDREVIIEPPVTPSFAEQQDLIAQKQAEEKIEQERPKGWFGISLSSLRNKISKTSETLISSVVNIASGKEKLDDDIIDEIEEKLIKADIGLDTAVDIADKIRDNQHKISPDKLKDYLKKEFTDIILSGQPDVKLNYKQGDLNIYLITGVNGVGKTTLIGKLAYRFREQGKKVLIGAGDTFRAAAEEQLNIWSDRAGADIVRRDGADPASVIYDAIIKAQKEHYDVLLIDTAGRLHNKFNLMQELGKIKKTIDKTAGNKIAESMLVLDATTGQNGLQQAKVFAEAVNLSSVALTKLDGSAKGGIIIAIAAEMNLPVKLVGVGEKIDDLRDFDPNTFIEALFS
jgi:fused signal recognition particle receptor